MVGRSRVSESVDKLLDRRIVVPGAGGIINHMVALALDPERGCQGKPRQAKPFERASAVLPHAAPGPASHADVLGG